MTERKTTGTGGGVVGLPPDTLHLEHVIFSERGVA